MTAGPHAPDSDDWPQTQQNYEIRVEGHLGDSWASWFDELAFRHTECGDTVLSGPLPDQTALHGVLMKIRDLGLTLISVTRIEEDQTNSKKNRARGEASMKVLAIMGSPHKGNSLEKTQGIEQKLRQLGDVDFEYIHLKDVNLKPCLGCFACFIRGEERCPLKDDRDMIARKLEEADGVLFVTPVYSMHVSYLMKQFIDRFACTFHRPRYFGKYAVTVAVAGNIGLRETLEYLKNVARSWGFQFVDELGYLAVPRRTPMRNIAIKKDHTDRVVEKFFTAMSERKPRKLTFSDHLHFRIMQASYLRLEEMSPTDYQHWKERGWLDGDAAFFCDDVRGAFYKDWVARGIGWMTGRQIDKALAKTT